MLFLTNINLNQNELQNAVIQPLTTAPAAPVLGQIYCNSSTKKIMWYNGTEWKTVGVVVESSATNGHIIVDGIDLTVYELPKATASTLGGIKVSDGLLVDTDGALSIAANSINNLTNYYLKSETYSQTEVNNLIGNLQTIQLKVLDPETYPNGVDSVPTEERKTNIIYLEPLETSGEDNYYTEYVWTGTAFEKIGSTAVDLTAYAKTEDLAEVAFSGDYNDLTNKPTIAKVNTSTITAGQTTHTVTLDAGVTILNVLVKDSTSGEVVATDVVCNANVATISLASEETSNLTVLVTYL